MKNYSKYVAVSCDGNCFHALRHVCVPISFRFGFSLFTALQSIDSCSSLCFPLQMQWEESKEDRSCCCRSCHHFFSNTQAVRSLQFAKFSSAYVKFHPRPPHNAAQVVVGLSAIACNQYSALATVPKFSQTCLHRTKRVCRPCSLPYTAASSRAAPCIRLVHST